MNLLSAWQVFPLLLVLGFLLYGNVLSYPFVHDDYIFIVGNTDIGRWNNLADVFLGRPQAMTSGQENINAYYRPLLDVTNRFLFLIFGGVPRGYHLVNILLHVLNGLWVFSILRAMALSRLFALGSSALFLVHPIQSEAVCAIAGISNLLSAFFCFASFFFYLRFRSASSVLARHTNLIAIGAFFFCALLSKESVVIFPFLILLHEILFEGPQGKEKGFLRNNILLAEALLLPLIAYFVLRQAAAIHFPALLSNTQELGLRLLSIPQTFLMYMRILFLPSDLHYYRSVDILHCSPIFAVVLCAVLGIYVFLRTKIDRAQRTVMDFGACWFLIALAPMMNIAPLINEYALILTSEHFLYFPLFGFVVLGMIIGQWIVRAIFRDKSVQVGMVVVTFVVLLASFIAKEQSRYWQGEIPLFQRTLRYQPQFGRVHLLLARAYYFEGAYQEAIAEYQIALGIMTEYADKTKGTGAQKTYQDFIHEIYFEIAHCYEGLRNPKEALKEYRKTFFLRQDDDRVYNNMGINYFLLKDFEKGAYCFRKALKLNPRHMMALNNLAFYYIQKGKFSRAEGILRKALKLDPLSPSLRQNLKEIIKAKEESVLSQEKALDR